MLLRMTVLLVLLVGGVTLGLAEPATLEVLQTIDGDGDTMIYRPDFLVFGPDGSSYVLNGGDSTVLHFDADWSLVRTFGREGEGPGEFVNATGLVIYQDKIWVFEMMRATLFSLEGEYLETRTSQLQMHEPVVTERGLVVRLGSNERLAALLDDQLELVEKLGPHCPSGEDFMEQYRTCGFVRALPHPDYLCLLMNPFDGHLYVLDDAGDVVREVELVKSSGESSMREEGDDSVSMSFSLVMGTGGVDRNGRYWTVPLPPDAEEGDPVKLVVLGRDLEPEAEYVLPEDVLGFRIYHAPDGTLVLLDGASSLIHVCGYPGG